MWAPMGVLYLQLGAEHRTGVGGWGAMVPRGGPSSPICGRLPLGELLLDECHVTLLVVKSLFRADSRMVDPLQVDSWQANSSSPVRIGCCSLLVGAGGCLNRHPLS